jgi:starch synthase
LPTVFTFYDATEQALLTEEAFQSFGVPDDKRKAFALGGQYSLLKGGLLLSRSAATFSAHLAEHASNVEFAGALGGSLNAAGVELFGIPAGLDYAVYNPATDTAIPTRYDVEASRVKGSCKSAVCRDLQLEIAPDVPLVVFAQPLSSASGADLVAAAVAALCKSPLQLIVAGSGEASLKKLLSSARLAKLANFRAVDRLAPDFERRLLSAADIALYPAREPGLGSPLRVAQRYGAVPVALSSAVARDIVVDCPTELQTGTGFLFDEATSDALRGGVERAVAAHASAGWAMLRRRVMRLDLGWERSAQRYFQLYKSALTNAQPLYAV